MTGVWLTQAWLWVRKSSSLSIAKKLPSEDFIFYFCRFTQNVVKSQWKISIWLKIILKWRLKLIYFVDFVFHESRYFPGIFGNSVSTLTLQRSSPRQVLVTPCLPAFPQKQDIQIWAFARKCERSQSDSILKKSRDNSYQSKWVGWTQHCRSMGGGLSLSTVITSHSHCDKICYLEATARQFLHTVFVWQLFGRMPSLSSNSIIFHIMLHCVSLTLFVGMSHRPNLQSYKVKSFNRSKWMGKSFMLQ